MPTSERSQAGKIHEGRSISQEAIIEQLERLLAEPVVRAERIGAGGNSRVYRVDTASGSYAVKHYFQNAADGRDRLEAEFRALQFLWDNNIRCVPQPLMAQPQLRLAVFQFIPGREPRAESVTEGDIDQLADFLASLRPLASAPDAAGLGPAAEASFTVADIVGNIRKRLDLLLATGDEAAAHHDMKHYLNSEFIPALIRWEGAARTSVGEEGYTQALPIAERTLSPSDFGFHNALRGDDGRLTFVDFEYFGWDDPAKLVSDFLWHPRSTMADSLKAHFAGRMMASYSDIPGIATRLEAVFPLFGLKWCMILLNEFRPENLARRRFASRSKQESEAVLDIQLGKAKETLERVNRGPMRFN